MAKKNYAPNSNDTILSSVIGWKPPVLHQKSECYISFLAFDPGVNRMRKKKIMLDHIKGKRNQRVYADQVIKKLTEKLMAGWNPWIEELQPLEYTKWDDVLDIPCTVTIPGWATAARWPRSGISGRPCASCGPPCWSSRLNVADSILLRRGEAYDEEEIAKRIGMPCFVKPAADGSSFGVSKVKNADQLAPAVRVAFMESNEVMIEGFLDGTEISQGIYKTAEKTVVLPATEVVTTNEFFDYDAKYNGQVQEITPARLSPETAEEVAKTTSRIYDILHANGIIRIDYIISKDKDGKDKVNMLEINTTPGMTVTSFIPQQVRAAGLDIKDVLSEIVENQF